MRFLSTRRTRDKVPNDDQNPALKDLAAQLGPWPDAGAIGTKLFLAAICLGVLAGPIAVAMQLTRPPAAAGPVQTSTDQDASSARAAASAELLVQRYLTATREQADALVAMVAQPPSKVDLPEQSPVGPGWVGAVKSERVATVGERHRWRVVVISTGGDSGPGQAWEVLVDVDPSGDALPLALPAQVPMPIQPTPDATGESLPLTHPAAAAAGGYANASLTGATELSRWTAPGHEPSPVTPPACTATDLSSVVDLSGHQSAEHPASGDRTHVLVTITCQLATHPAPGPSTSPSPSTTPQPRTRTIQMVLHLAGRDGRWEITPAPVQTPSTSTQSTP